MRGKKPLTPLESVAAFEAKVDRNGPIPEGAPHLGRCWLWTGGVNRKDAAEVIDFEPVRDRADVQLVSDTVRAIGRRLAVDCPLNVPVVRHCLNPAHLEAVTRQENIRRADMSKNGSHERAKTHCPQGHPYDEQNTYWYRGHRQCITCRAAHTAAHNAKRVA